MTERSQEIEEGLASLPTHLREAIESRWPGLPHSRAMLDFLISAAKAGMHIAVETDDTTRARMREAVFQLLDDMVQIARRDGETEVRRAEGGRASGKERRTKSEERDREIRRAFDETNPNLSDRSRQEILRRSNGWPRATIQNALRRTKPT